MFEQASITGIVIATNSERLSGVLVTLECESLPHPQDTVTDSTGMYLFNSLPPGAYNLTATVSGMRTGTMVVGVFTDQEVRRDFILEPSSTV